MIELAVTLGVTMSLFFMEAFGMAAGGIIVPGYVALQLGTPDRLVGLLLTALLTYCTIYLVGKRTFLFGRRQMVVSLLVGTIYSIISHHLLFFNTETSTLELSAVGWVIPGLIGHWAMKQGFLKTIAMLSIISVLVRMVVIVVYNGNPIPELY